MRKTFWQFNIGHLITILTMAFSAGIFYGKYSEDSSYTKDAILKLSSQYEDLNGRVYRLEGTAGFHSRLNEKGAEALMNK